MLIVVANPSQVQMIHTTTLQMCSRCDDKDERLFKKISFKRVYINTRLSRSSSHAHTLYQEDPMHTSRGRVHVRETLFQEVVFHSRIKDWRITTKFIPSAFQKTTLIHDSIIFIDSRHTHSLFSVQKEHWESSHDLTSRSHRPRLNQALQRQWESFEDLFHHTNCLHQRAHQIHSYKTKITRTSFITIYH